MLVVVVEVEEEEGEEDEEVCGVASGHKQLHGLAEASAATSQLVNPAARHCCTSSP